MTSNCSTKFHYNPTVTLRTHQGVSFHRHDTCIGNTVSIDLSHAFLLYLMDGSWLRWDIATADLTDNLTKNVTSKDNEKSSIVLECYLQNHNTICTDKTEDKR